MGGRVGGGGLKLWMGNPNATLNNSVFIIL